MKLYPELFLTPWHFVVLIAAVIAFSALIIGKYDGKTVVKNTAISALMVYVFITFILMVVMQDSMYKKETMISELDNEYTESAGKWNKDSDDDVALYVGAYRLEKQADIRVYAGNYHDSETFNGDITVVVHDHDNQEVFTKTYESVTLRPGEKKQLEQIYTEQPMDTYRFGYETRPYM